MQEVRWNCLAPRDTILMMKGKLLTFLALALLAIPAASPYFLPGVPRTNDLITHLVRSLLWGEAVSYSGLWPRWSAELVYGYGYPVFNFFPSLFHAFVQLIYQLGLPLLTAYRVVVYLHFLFAAATSYWLGKEVFGSSLAGWGAAVVYVYSPYLLYDAIVRGSGPETQALALLPLLVLAIWKASEPLTGHRGQRGGRCRAVIFNLHAPEWVVVTAVLFTITLLSHPIVYQLLIPIGVWVLIKAAFGAKRGELGQTLVGPALGIGLGVMLSAFYLLPAFVDVGMTQSDQAISQGYTYQTNFLTWLDMMRWPTIPADPALINPPVVRSLPVVGLLWAVVVIAGHWRRSTRSQREIAVAWTAVLLLSAWLITPYSQWVWDYFPLLRLTFYPWRLLSMSALATAVLVALSMKMIEDRSRRIKDWANFQSSAFNFLPSLAFTCLILISSIPWLYPPRLSMPEDITMAYALSQELPPLFIGTTTLGEFLPATVAELPGKLPEEAELRAGHNPDRLQPAEGLTWTRLDENPIDARYEVVMERPLTAVYRQFAFPGWQVWVDGEVVPITPGEPHGLITFPVPAGNHDVQISFTNTRARWLGGVVSFVALVMVIGFAIYSLINGKWFTVGGRWRERAAPSSIQNPQLLILWGITAVLLWLFFSFVDTPLRQNTLLAEGIRGKPVITPLDYAGEVRLLSVEAPTAPVAADDEIALTLYFQALRDIGVPYHIGVQVRDADGFNWMADDARPFDWRFIAEEPWPLEAYRMEPFLITLAEGTPPGTYKFHVGLVRADTGQTVASHDLGDLFVSMPSTGEKPLEEGMVAAAGAASENLQLLGTRLDRKEAAPGDPMRVTALWQALAPGAQNEFTLQLVSSGGEVLLSQVETIAPLYPPEQWEAGDRLRSESLFRLPASMPQGKHTWQIFWGDVSVVVGEVQVNAPERSFEIVAMETAVGETYGDAATLLGLNANRETGEVTLVWQAENETQTSYRVFVHLLTADDAILSQSDGEPVQWSRPTTGWLPGEILQDTHKLSFPDSPDGLRLRIGLYDPQTGQRLPTETGDSVTVFIP